MNDMEKIITHLQIIHTWAKFARKCDLQFFTPKHLEDIAQWTDEAITLLKEQKPIKPKIDAFGHPYCPKCKVLVHPTWNFCPHCGQEMQLE